MFLSRAEIVAIVAVVEIATYGQEQPVRAKEIAARNKLARRYLDPMLYALSGSGILIGKRGPRGGFRLNRAPRLITVNDIERAVRTTQQADLGKVRSWIATRIVIPALDDAQETFSRALQRITIHDLVRRAFPPWSIVENPKSHHMRLLNDKAAICLLGAEVKKAGGQAAWARRKRVSRVVLNRVLKGHDQIPPSILKAIKLRTAYLHDTHVLTEDRAVILLLRSEVEKAGSQLDWAQRKGINRTELNKVLNGQRPMRPSIRAALKLRTVYLRNV
jgi:Rrf2 family protein